MKHQMMQRKLNNQRRHEGNSSRIGSWYVYTGLFLALWSITFFIIACGKKGGPVPPREKPPPAVKNLKETIQGDQLTLTWTARSLKKLAGFYVYRSKTSVKEPECKGCPVLFTRIADMSLETIADTSLFSYTDTLEIGYRYIYKVTAYSIAGLISNDSNFVEFTY
jgi:hypothetical protein